MDKFIEYAPWLVVAYLFFKQSKMFVTPEVLAQKFVDYEGHLEKKFVLKETYTVTISEIKSDIEDIKDTLAKIYDKLMNG